MDTPEEAEADIVHANEAVQNVKWCDMDWVFGHGLNDHHLGLFRDPCGQYANKWNATIKDPEDLKSMNDSSQRFRPLGTHFQASITRSIDKYFHELWVRLYGAHIEAIQAFLIIPSPGKFNNSLLCYRPLFGNSNV